MYLVRTYEVYKLLCNICSNIFSSILRSILSSAIRKTSEKKRKCPWPYTHLKTAMSRLKMSTMPMMRKIDMRTGTSQRPGTHLKSLAGSSTSSVQSAVPHHQGSLIYGHEYGDKPAPRHTLEVIGWVIHLISAVSCITTTYLTIKGRKYMDTLHN